MTAPGAHMAAEASEAPAAFARAFATALDDRRAAQLSALRPGAVRAFHWAARGSSDAAVAMLAPAFMAATGRVMTRIPLSVFSLGHGVDMADTLTFLVSQSGASDDLIRTAQGIRTSGGRSVAIVNAPDSPVAGVADVTLSAGAGPERAVPATKSVAASVGAGLAVLAALAPDLHGALDTAVRRVGAMHADAAPGLARAIAGAGQVYVIGRGTGLGAAQEAALKIKECCALPAEAHSAAEVLHGPLALASPAMLALVLDTGVVAEGPSLDRAAGRLAEAGARVRRLGAPSDLPAAVAAVAVLCTIWPAVRDAAIALNRNPDRPAGLAKVTRTL